MMGGFQPEIGLVALKTKRGAGIVLHEEFAVLIVVWVMAGGALELVVVVKAHLLGQRSGVFELAVGGNEGVVVGEGDRVVIGEIGAQIARALGHARDVVAHLNRGSAAGHHAERHSSI